MKITTTSDLKAVRESRGMKQAELAVAAGVSISTLSRHEAWGVPITRPTAKRICAALHVPIKTAFPNLTAAK